ncbi:Nn.00g003280.m01.CDS01 [Neocucurbitaria sp. VM-36]
MARGILWVSSRIANPDGLLTPETFCDWYENVRLPSPFTPPLPLPLPLPLNFHHETHTTVQRHIPEVLALPGMPSAARFSALDPQPDDAKAWSHDAPWLTVYEMPDIEYRNTSAFKGLDGQSLPEKELLEGVFKNARFDTRFYEEVQVYGKGGGGEKKGPATFLISAALEPPASNEADADFDAWYRNEHLDVLARAPGYVRTRRYKLVNGTTLDRFVRVELDVPKYLALHEFQSDVLPWKELGESARTEWARRVMGGLVKEEVGWYVLKRKYAESEWGGVGF